MPGGQRTRIRLWVKQAWSDATPQGALRRSSETIGDVALGRGNPRVSRSDRFSAGSCVTDPLMMRDSVDSSNRGIAGVKAAAL